jgi:uncharacterized membrane protein
MRHSILIFAIASHCSAAVVWATPADVLRTHCHACHSGDEKQGGLDLAALPQTLTEPENFAKWVKIYDRIDSGEMPPKVRTAAVP